jgi:hypothetical protein
MRHPPSIHADLSRAWTALHARLAPLRASASVLLPWLASYLRKPALLLCWSLCTLAAASAQDVQTLVVDDSPFELAYESLVETIEGEGYVVASVQHFGDMLDRTTQLAPGGAPSVYLHARVVLFCSARLAHAMRQEDPTQIALCPLSVALYVRRNKPTQVVFAWRGPTPSTPARQQAEVLLNDVVRRAARLARTR